MGEVGFKYSISLLDCFKFEDLAGEANQPTENRKPPTASCGIFNIIVPQSSWSNPLSTP